MNVSKTKNKVLVNGVKYHSVCEAFLKLELPLAKHQLFRKKLKIEKKATYAGYEFEVVE